MSVDETPKQEDNKPGAPAWVMTFADLMSLLMCFFVLLLAFSEMDIEKYKQLAGSMKMAFGVQNKLRAEQIPRGTSIIAKQFSPGKPEPTVVDQVRQKTTDRNEKELDLSPDKKRDIEIKTRTVMKHLSEEVRNGQLEVDVMADKVIIRILEKGSFPSAMAELDQDFLPVIDKIRLALADLKGTIKVSGHTDDRPIETGEFRSNWELSSSRALSVVHALTTKKGLDPKRFEVVGYADTRPIAPNDSDENRAKNRRVDIILQNNKKSETKSESSESVLSR